MSPRPRTASTGRRHSSSRELVLRTLESRADPAPISALARDTGLHENTVRAHLEQLLADGYVARVRERASGRGRPAWLWRALAAGPGSPYAALAGVLAEGLARTSPAPAQDARRAGVDWGRALSAELPRADDLASARRAVLEMMESQGFAPEETDHGGRAGSGGGAEIALRRCPLLDAAARHPQIVCSVHRGLIEGILETVGRDQDRAAVDVELIPFASPGRCALALRERAS